MNSTFKFSSCDGFSMNLVGVTIRQYWQGHLEDTIVFRSRRAARTAFRLMIAKEMAIK